MHKALAVLLSRIAPKILRRKLYQPKTKQNYCFFEAEGFDNTRYIESDNEEKACFQILEAGSNSFVKVNLKGNIYVEKAFNSCYP